MSRPLHRAFCAASIVCVAALAPFMMPSTAKAELAVLALPDGRYYAKGRLLVQTRAGLNDAQVDKALKGHAAKRKAKIEKLGVHIIELPEQANEMAVAKALRNNPNFEAVELDYAYEPEMTVNDTYFGNAWHLPKMGVTSAWDYVSSTPTIAILDSGVNGAHPDLAGQMVSGWNFYNNNSDTSDVYGHGTKVAGAAAATGNNALGVVGVSFRSKIMPIRVTDTAGYGYSSAMANGIRWAADNGAKVANLSFRNVAGDSIVINAANYMRSKGGVVVAAGGNTGGELVLVASSAITAVAATNSADARTSWSSWGKHIDVAAPGEGIWVTTMSGGYGGSSGTSFSTPVTAGVYALLMGANPNLSPAQLDEILFSTAKDVHTSGFDLYTGYGRVDALAAVKMALGETDDQDTQAPNASISSPTGGTVSGTVSVSVAASDNVGVSKVELLVNGQVIGSDTSAPYGFAWTTTGLSNGSKQLQARAHDAAGNIGSSASVSVTVSNDATAPSVSVSSPRGGSTVKGTVTVSMNASDNVGVTRVDLLVDGVVKASDTTSPYAISWNSTSATNGTHTLQAKAYDAAGNVGTSSSVSVNVSNDATSPWVSITSPPGGSTVKGTVTVSMNASDNVGVTRVDLLVDGVVKASDTSSPYAISWDSTTVTNGAHTLQAKAYDAAGNVGSSSSVTVTASNNAASTDDDVAPVVSITNPIDGSQVARTLSVQVSASDNVGVSKLALTIDGKQVASVSNTSSLVYSWSVIWAGGTTPTSVIATATDAAGNTSSHAITVKR